MIYDINLPRGYSSSCLREGYTENDHNMLIHAKTFCFEI